MDVWGRCDRSEKEFGQYLDLTCRDWSMFIPLPFKNGDTAKSDQEFLIYTMALLRPLAFSPFSDIIKLLKTGGTTMSAATDIRLVELKDINTQLNTTIQNHSELLDSFKDMI